MQIKSPPVSTGICEVNIWQQNISKTIVAHVPVYQDEQGNVQVQETGDFELDGVTFLPLRSKLNLSIQLMPQVPCSRPEIWLMILM